MQYRHTQRGWVHYILYATTVLMLGVAWGARGDPVAFWILIGTGLLTGALGPTFHHLTVCDEVDCLAVRYGPLPMFGKRIRYDEITQIDADRTTLLDGWGIHYFPGRGWTYNISGFDCVKLTMGRRVIRVGSDDVENLTEFLRQRTG
ncbi:MAG: hypothetical protein HQ567_22090 [Candidatus Nealsonbacteria bacterium]|nr:hypothetical protein [Candidatus Nealsonbacteria bacterium]